MVYGNFNQRRSFAPVKVGEELDVKIEAVGEKGDGVCKKNGFVLFVPGVKEGDEVITSGGMYGRVDHIENNIIYLKIAENVKIRVEKTAVANVVGVTDKLAKK